MKPSGHPQPSSGGTQPDKLHTQVTASLKLQFVCTKQTFTKHSFLHTATHQRASSLYPSLENSPLCAICSSKELAGGTYSQLFRTEHGPLLPTDSNFTNGGLFKSLPAVLDCATHFCIMPLCQKTEKQAEVFTGNSRLDSNFTVISAELFLS